ncbi:MAG: sulfotransferase family protein [Myxococcota bacterium]
MSEISTWYGTEVRTPGAWERCKREVKDALRWASGRAASLAEAPVFVLGHQKSGTSAIAALLGEVSGLPATVDLQREVHKPSYLELSSGRTTFERFVQRNRLDFSRPIIKEANLTPYREELVRCFPGARFVFVVRDPRDNIRSILNRLDVRGDLDELQPGDPLLPNPGWRLILRPGWLEIEGRNYVERLAARWVRFAHTYWEAPGQFELIRYEDFMASKAAVIEDLARRLGLPTLRDISSRVDVQYQPRGNKGVDWLEFFGKRNLAWIDQRCSGWLERFGYRPFPHGHRE